MMEDRPKNKLSLKRNNQRKLNFTTKPQDVHKNTDTSTTTTNVTDDVTVNPNGPPLSGLCNLGNTCYVNSLLQTLRYCPALCQNVGELHEMLLEQQSEREKEIGCADGVVNGIGGLSNSSEAMDCSNSQQAEPANKKQSYTLAMHLYSLWQRMLQKEKSFIRTTNKITTLTPSRPDAFIAKLKEDHPVFDNKFQQDAQEMLRYLLTNLHETYTRTLLHQTSSTSAKQLPLDLESKEHCSSGVGCSEAVIDVDSYHLTHQEQQHTVKAPLLGVKRKLGVSESKKPSKFRKVAYKSLTEYYSPVKQQQSLRIQQSEVADVKKRGKVQSTGKLVDFVSGMFQGKLAYQMRCFECESYTRRTEEFLDISVPVVSTTLPGFPACASPMKSIQESGPASSQSNSSTVGLCSLSWALSQFALREKLRRENKYFCDSCGHFVEAERSVLFSHLPSIITVHLNRFTTQTWGLSSSVMVNKVTGNIAIPLTLSLKPWCTDDCKEKDRIYELFSVIFHSGTSCTSGHYTSCVRAKEVVAVAPSEAGIEPNKWLYFDDDFVEYLSQDKLLEMLSPLSIDSCTPYILFYNVSVM